MYNPLKVPLLSHITSCTPARSILSFSIVLVIRLRAPALYRLLTFQVPNLMTIFLCHGYSRLSIKFRGPIWCFWTSCFYSVRLLASCQTPKLEGHPLLAVHNCLFNISRGLLPHLQPEGMHYAMVTGTHVCTRTSSIVFISVISWLSLSRLLLHGLSMNHYSCFIIPFCMPPSAVKQAQIPKMRRVGIGTHILFSLKLNMCDVGSSYHLLFTVLGSISLVTFHILLLSLVINKENVQHCL